jgi:hypothetical protein
MDTAATFVLAIVLDILFPFAGTARARHLRGPQRPRSGSPDPALPASGRRKPR